MIRIIKKTGVTIVVLALLNIIYLLLMTAAFAVPADKSIKENIGLSLYTWKSEGELSPIFDDPESFWSDFGSDMIWANIAASNVDDPLMAAISLPNCRTSETVDGEESYYNLIQALYFSDSPETIHAQYSRYWMLIAAIVRVLFLWYQIKEIRYIFYFIIAFLMAWICYKVTKLLDWRGIVPLATAMMIRVWLMHSISLSTMTDIWTTLNAMIFLSYVYDRKWFKGKEYIFYMITGSLAYAVGPMVAPLLTLGMPLVFHIILNHKRDKEVKSWIWIVQQSFFWVIGYAVTILVKAGISFCALGGESTTETVWQYLGVGQGIGERLDRVVYCLHGLLKPLNVKIPMLALLLIVLIICFIKRGIQNCQFKFQLSFIALYPMIWAFIIVEHSRHYFVANMFSVLVYAILSILVFLIKDKGTSNNE